MLILVTMRVIENATYPERRDALSHDWSSLFMNYGIVPVLIPSALADPLPYFAIGAKGLLLTGGDNLGLEGEPSARDRIEAKLLVKAIATGMPTFGVCRGLQMINRYFGGHVARTLPEPHVGLHEVRLASGQTLTVNSFHDQGITSVGLAPELVPFAETRGGVVEGLRHKNLPITAVQWHPERTSPSGAFDRELLSKWLSTCA